MPDKVDQAVPAQIADGPRCYPLRGKEHRSDAAEGPEVAPQGAAILILEYVHAGSHSLHHCEGNSQVSGGQQPEGNGSGFSTLEPGQGLRAVFQQISPNKKGHDPKAGIQVPGQHRQARLCVKNAHSPHSSRRQRQRYRLFDQPKQPVSQNFQQEQAGQKPDGPQPSLDQHLQAHLPHPFPKARRTSCQSRLRRDDGQGQRKIGQQQFLKLPFPEVPPGPVRPKKESGQEEKQRHMEGIKPPGNRVPGHHMGKDDCQHPPALGRIHPGDSFPAFHIPSLLLHFSSPQGRLPAARQPFGTER